MELQNDRKCKKQDYPRGLVLVSIERDTIPRFGAKKLKILLLEQSHPKEGEFAQICWIGKETRKAGMEFPKGTDFALQNLNTTMQQHKTVTFCCTVLPPKKVDLDARGEQSFK